MKSIRVVLYGLATVALTVPAYVEGWMRPSGNLTLWGVWVASLALLWCSWPRWHRPALRWATRGLTAIVVLNFSTTVFVVVTRGEDAPTLDPNLNVILRFTDAAQPPGIFGDQHITTDAHGFRTSGPVDYSAKPPGVIRVVAIGASTTEDIKLDDRKTWTDLLGERLRQATGRKVEVINTALSGLRAEHNYRMLLEIERLQPDFVTFVLGVNDWNHAILKTRWSMWRRLSLRLRPLSPNNTLLYRFIRRSIAHVRPASPSGRPAQLRIDDGSFTAPFVNALERKERTSFPTTDVDADYASWVGKIVEECRKRSLNCVFGDQPTAYSTAISDDLRRQLWMTPPYATYTLSLQNMIDLSSRYNAWLAETAKQNGIDFCSLAANVPATLDYLIDDCHFNEAGAQRIAELMSDCLLTSGKLR